jgi:hypothetical protein
MSRTRTRRLATAAVAVAAGAVPLAGAVSASAATAPVPAGLPDLTDLAGAVAPTGLLAQAAGTGQRLAGAFPVAGTATPAQHLGGAAGDLSKPSGPDYAATVAHTAAKATRTTEPTPAETAQQVNTKELSGLPVVGPLAAPVVNQLASLSNNGVQQQTRSALPGGLTGGLPGVSALPLAGLGGPATGVLGSTHLPTSTLTNLANGGLPTGVLPTNQLPAVSNLTKTAANVVPGGSATLNNLPINGKTSLPGVSDATKALSSPLSSLPVAGGNSLPSLGGLPAVGGLVPGV